MKRELEDLNQVDITNIKLDVTSGVSTSQVCALHRISLGTLRHIIALYNLVPNSRRSQT